MRRRTRESHAKMCDRASKAASKPCEDKFHIALKQIEQLINVTNLTEPECTAQCHAVLPSMSFSSGSAPRLSNLRTFFGLLPTMQTEEEEEGGGGAGGGGGGGGTNGKRTVRRERESGCLFNISRHCESTDLWKDAHIRGVMPALSVTLMSTR